MGGFSRLPRFSTSYQSSPRDPHSHPLHWSSEQSVPSSAESGSLRSSSLNSDRLRKPSCPTRQSRCPCPQCRGPPASQAFPADAAAADATAGQDCPCLCRSLSDFPVLAQAAKLLHSSLAQVRVENFADAGDCGTRSSPACSLGWHHLRTF